ncbi:MAG: biotin/lipoyl-containing protein [Bacillota bacterium]|nr:biotin/lipoyl-containing protein [Bacillota bacterium]
MKTFKVTVDGQVYNVQVEEMNERVNKIEPAPTRAKPAQNRSAEPASGELKSNETAAKKENKVPDKVPDKQAGEEIKVEAPMPGSILEIKVTAGDAVKEGAVLLVFEAMKMENELTAPRSGTVAEIRVKKGDSVNSGDILIVLIS